MNIHEYLPAWSIPALTWLGQSDWLNITSVDKTNYEAHVNIPFVRPAEITEAIEQIEASLQDDICDQRAVILFLMSRALAGGPKILRLTHSQCEALEHVDLKIPFVEYAQPYPSIFVEIPPSYREYLTNTFGHKACRFGLSAHLENKYVIAATIPLLGESGVYVILSPEHNNLEEAFNVPNGTGADLRFGEVIQRITINAAYMLAHLGHKNKGSASPQQKKKLLKTTKSAKMAKAEKAKAALSVLPTLIGFEQEVEFHSEVSEPLGGLLSSSAKKPHWRRGHFRRVAVGVGRTAREIRFIKPRFINRGLFVGHESETTVFYSGDLEIARTVPFDSPSELAIQSYQPKV